MRNTPGLDGQVIYALDKGEDNVRLFPCFPERQFYIYAGTLENGILSTL